MRTRRVSLWTPLLVAFLLALGIGPAAIAAAPPATSPAAFGHHAQHVCSEPATPGTARCHSLVHVDATGKAVSHAAPAGYAPADLQSAYNLAAALSSFTGSPTVAIVDAYDDPYAASNLNVYRSTFGLPSCTTSNGCFSKVNQSGGTRYPARNVGWSEEISLDLDMVSAICPNCHILLVEASNNSYDNLGKAVNYAASRSNVVAISNSYGGSEWSGETTYASLYYNHPGKAITASSGDNGYGVEFPAASGFVTAVGGTSLNKNSDGTFSESVWSGAGSGCSAFVAKPSWQHDAGCANRTIADVAAIADPNTGVAVYDTYGVGGWLVFGGTSVASPIVAGVYALAGNAASVNYGSYPYLHDTAGTLHDVTTGSNGSCGGSYLCTGGAGYDGPTGLGTPNGSGGF